MSAPHPGKSSYLDLQNREQRPLFQPLKKPPSKGGLLTDYNITTYRAMRDSNPRPMGALRRSSRRLVYNSYTSYTTVWNYTQFHTQ